MGRIDFDKIFNNDPLGLLNVEISETPVQRSASDQRLIDSFIEINDFFEVNKREPQIGTDIEEFMLASRLQAMRNSAEKVKILLPFDFYDLLKAGQSKSITVEDILGDDPLDLLNDEGMDNSIFTLKHVKKSDRIRPDYISRRNKCKDFENYEPLFESVHSDLKSGTRKLVEFKESDLDVGKFFVLRGILLFLEKSEHTEQEFDYSSGSRIRSDGRTRCIFDNGTESDMLYRSLYKALLKDGFSVSDKEEIIPDDNITDEDVQNGYVYVLSSLSSNPQVAEMKDLYKIGCCSGTVSDRIKNATNEPTYLMSEVKVELTVRCFNMNVFSLESKIHNFFNKCNVAFEVLDNDGNKHYPREWFTAPLSVIEEAIKLAVSRHIDEYEYNVELKLPVRKNVSYFGQTEAKALMVAEEKLPYGTKKSET